MKQPFRLILVALLMMALPGTSEPSGVRYFRLQSRASFLTGTLEGIAVDGVGTLRLAGTVGRIADVGEPFLFTASAHPDGWVLGTGNSGKILLLHRGGELEVLYSAAEPEIFAVWADPDGSVFAGSSPGGKVYRIKDGEAQVFFDPGETYIWALGRAANGNLLVATGTQGRLYSVDGAGKGQVLFESEDTHLRAMHVLPTGEVLVGTAGEGLILRVDPRGRARTLFDAAYPEVVAFAASPEGVSYAAVLASEASLVDLSSSGSSATKGIEDSNGSSDQEDGASVRVTVSDAGDTAGATGTRPTGFSGPRSEVLRISAAGSVETVARFAEETVHSLLWQGGRLWIGTGQEGKVYSLRERGRPVLEQDMDERQVVALITDEAGPALGTTNAASFYRISENGPRRGLYTSSTLDAGQISSFGSLRWQGDTPGHSSIGFSVRSGLSSTPDATWSAWSHSSQGHDMDLSDVPSGRFFQWRAELEAEEGETPSLSEIIISYAQANLPPRIESVEVLDPGQVLVPSNFNPTNQVFEPAHPNRDGIFTTLEASSATEDRRLKTLWKKGYRTLRWKAEDPNEDELTYELSFRPARGDGAWLTMAESLQESHYSFDATVLPDGRYYFRLEVSDRRDTEIEQALVEEETSELVLVDHTPPFTVSVKRSGGRMRIEVGDELNPLREALVSTDAGEWKRVDVEDGLLDGLRETLVLDDPPGSRLLLLRIMDAAFNVVTVDLGQADR